MRAVFTIGRLGQALLGIFHRPHPQPEHPHCVLHSRLTFFEVVEERKLTLEHVQPLHVPAYVEELGQTRAEATIRCATHNLS